MLKRKINVADTLKSSRRRLRRLRRALPKRREQDDVSHQRRGGGRVVAQDAVDRLTYKAGAEVFGAVEDGRAPFDFDRLDARRAGFAQQQTAREGAVLEKLDLGIGQIVDRALARQQLGIAAEDIVQLRFGRVGEFGAPAGGVDDERAARRTSFACPTFARSRVVESGFRY